MTGQTCALLRCSKPPWPSVPQGDAPALACGNLHHQLLMASRFNPGLPHPYQAILDRNDAGLCALRSCKEAPRVGHAWCSRTHYLLWLKEFTSSLLLDQICAVPSCTRHVFVDDNGVCSQFCGWRHEQKGVMLSALQHRRQESPPSVEASSQQPASPASLNESECGHTPSLNSLMRSLKQFACSKVEPKNIRVIEDFYEKHPWEVLTEGHVCWLIVRLKFTGKTRKLTTKDHYHWKQSGRRAKKSKYTEKYYTYTKRKGKAKEAEQKCAERTYTKKEYMMESVECYSLVRLVKEKPTVDGKIAKEQPRKQEIVNQVDNPYSQDTTTSKVSLWNDDSSVDSIYGGLIPLNDFASPVIGAEIPMDDDGPISRNGDGTYAYLHEPMERD